MASLKVKSSQSPTIERNTEVGYVPASWRVLNVGSFAQVKTGPFGSALHERDYVDQGTPIITVEHLGEYGITTQNLPRVSDVDRRRLDAYSLKEGDIVFSRVGSIDRNAYISKVESGWLFSGRLLRVRISAPEVCPRYLSYYFHSEPFKDRVRSVAVGQTMASLNTGILSGLMAAVPPEAEQKAIAEALSDADELIEGLEALIAKKRAIKQGVMQDLLSGRRRLPGFSKNWTSVLVSDVADIRSGGTPSTTKSEYWDGNVPWCTPTDITALGTAKYLRETSRTISETGLNNSSAEWVPPGSVIMTSRATIGECAINLQPITTNQGFKNLIPKECAHTEFLYYYMTTQKERMIALCGGSTFLEISKAQLSSLEIMIPKDKEEQIAISQILADIDDELSILEGRLSKFRQIKQGMMQDLLTGRVRLV